jgi:predicted PurR-regulated permease PerM
MADQDIQKADLYLLLDSYKNSVELSTIIMEQLRQITDLQSKFNETGTGSIQKQKEIYNSLEKIANLLESYSNNIKNSNDKVYDKIIEFEKSLSTFQVEQKGLFGKVGSRINLVYVGLGTLIVSLISIIYLLIEKLHLISDIANKLGVGSNIP